MNGLTQKKRKESAATEEDDGSEDTAMRGRRRGRKDFLGDIEEKQRTVWELCEEVFAVATSTAAMTGKQRECSRVVYVAAFAQGLQTKKDLSSYYEAFWSRTAAEVTGHITGLSLVLPQSTVHLVEAHPKVVRDLLRDIASTASTERQLLRDVKIVSYTEDITERAFPMWEFRVLQYDRAIELGTGDSEPEAAHLLTSSCYSGMLRLGEGLSRLKEKDRAAYEAAIDNLRASAFKDHVPSAETISGIIEAREVFSLNEWLLTYDGPLNIEFDTDQIWTLA